MMKIGWALGTALAALIAVAACGIVAETAGEKKTDKSLARATFAGGCFWCMEPAFEKLDGVRGVVSGYTGGQVKNPSYEQVSTGGTGHLEAVEVRYDPSRVSYERLLEVFWRQIDPTDAGGQFVDRGPQYATAIYYHDDEQRQLAEASKAALAASGSFGAPIVTPILPAGPFFAAEEYHQDYYKKNPSRYKYYRWGSGRDRFLEKQWGGDEMLTERPQEQAVPAPEKRDWRAFRKPARGELERILTPLQFRVTQEEGTERPFKNEYWDEHREGIYVDVVSGEPLFASRDKFDSGTGWPSFSRPLAPEQIEERRDRRLFFERTEVRSRGGDSHLGHVFDDGPPPTGLRYCINSAALRFIPAARLTEEGYGEYADRFGEAPRGSGAGR